MAPPAPLPAAVDRGGSAGRVRRLWGQRLRPSQRATLGTVFAGVCGQGIVLVSGVLVARILIAEDRGLLQLLWLFPMVLTLIGGLGLPMATTYQIARSPGRARAIVGLVWRPVLLQAAVLVAVHAAILSRILADQPAVVRAAGWATLLGIPAALAQQYGLSVLQGQQRFQAFNLLRLLPAAMYSAAIVALALAGRGNLPHILLAWICTYCVVGACSLATALRGLPAGQRDSEPVPLRQMFHFGLNGFLGWASPVDNFRLDQLVVGLFLSTPALGLYVVGMACANLPRFLAQSVGMVAYPRIAARRGAPDAYHAIWRYFWFAVAICALAVLALEAAVGWLVPFFFTEEYASAVPITRTLLLASLLYSGRRVLADGARGAGYPLLDSLTEAVSWLVLFPALAILTPRFDVQGVAWSLVISSAVSLALLAVLIVTYRRRLEHRAAVAPAVEAGATVQIG